eukprot:sb/3479411/
MLKKNCTVGEEDLCWNEQTKAMVIGSYFYGYTVQIISVYLARRFNCMLGAYRLYLVVGIVSQFAYPMLAQISLIDLGRCATSISLRLPCSQKYRIDIESFGIPIAMIGSMLKKNCTVGEEDLCWSEQTKAMVIGSYFYGYTVQIISVYLARRFNCILGGYRLYLVVGIVSQFTYPMLAQVSLVGLISLQALRGFMTGIMVAYLYTFEFQSRWIPAHLRRTFISVNGAICYIGNGTGGLLVEFFSSALGWEYYFYFSGVLFIVLLILSLIFMADKPENSWLVKSLSGGKEIKKEVKVAVEKKDVEGNGEKYIEEEEKKDNEEKASPSTTPTSVSVRDILSRGYLYMRLIYYLSYSLIWYNTLSTGPFYLHNILRAGTKPIAVLETSLSFVMAGSSILLSWIFQTLDKHLSWLTCRLTFIYIPMVIQLVVFIGFPYIATFTGASFLLVLSTVASGSMFSGSLTTANVEIDPVNAPIIQALFNGAGQIAGFLGPALMTWLTTGRDRGWRRIFHVLPASASVDVSLEIKVSVYSRPGEWKNRSKSGESFRKL